MNRYKETTHTVRVKGGFAEEEIQSIIRGLKRRRGNSITAYTFKIAKKNICT